MGKATTFSQKLVRVLVYAMLICLAVTYLYPLFFMAINSLKTPAEYLQNIFSIKIIGGRFEAYLQLFKDFKIGRYLLNTLYVSVMKLLFVMPLSIFASYAFAKLRFRGKDTVYPAIMIGSFIPFQVIMIPVYVMLARVKLLDTFTGLILFSGSLGIPSCIMMLTGSFRSVPGELLEAATIDGCGYFRKVFNIMVPLGKPAISISIITSFITSWNDLLAPTIVLKSVDKRLIMPALNSLVTQHSMDMPYQLAGLLLASLPAVLIYLILQKQIIMGITAGSTK